MAGRIRQVQNSFTSGELTPRLSARTDVEYYFNGAETVENWVILPQGGLKTRPGTRMIAEVGEADISKEVRLIPFQFNDEQAYILELGEDYVRVYKDTARVESPPGTPVEVVTTYLSGELFELQFDQSADVMWLTHRLHKPRKLSRTSHTAWTIADYAPANDPFTSAGTFPRAVGFWKSRLWFGGTDTGPNEFWATQVDDFESLDPGTELDDEAINGRIAGGKINVIRWLAGIDKQLFVGTFGSEMLIKGDSSGKVAPATVNVTPATEHGVAALRPIKASGYLLFLQRSRRKIRQLSYDFNSDSFLAPDLLLLAEHIAKVQLDDVAYQEDADPIVWAVRADGQLAGATYLPSHKVLGWHRHITDGAFESVAVIPHPDGDRDQVWAVVRRTIDGVEKRFVEVFEDGAGYYGQYTLDCALHYDGKVDDTTTLALSAATGDDVTVTASAAVFEAGDVGKQLWHPAGLTAGAIEITGFTDTTHVTGNVVVDFEGTAVEAGWRKAVMALTGLDHLEGHTVQVLVDGATHPERTVSAGAVSLELFTARAEVGLPFTPKLVPLIPETHAGGSVMGLAVTRSDLKLRVLDTVTLTVNGQTLPERSSDDAMDVAPEPFSGDLTVPQLDWENGAQVVITQDVPLPATLVALMGNVWFGDE